MEQRPLRLGDIVDDYCPRERRITNHAIVALVGDAIRQTRCTTCDAEHIYKHGREPRRRKKDEAGLYGQVLAEVTAGQEGPGQLVTRAPSDDPDVLEAAAPAAGNAAEPGATGEPAETPDEPAPPDDAWPAHRQLIRATLPRVDGEPPAPRPIPEFTMHQRPPARGNGYGFRFGQGRNGNVAHPTRDGRGGRGGHPNGQGPNQPHGEHNGGGRPGRRRGRKRSR